MKVQFIKNPIYLRLGYSQGDIADLPDHQAEELIADGYAVKVETEQPKELKETKTEKKQKK